MCAPASPAFSRLSCPIGVFLRFVLKNRNQNVFFYQSPTRFAGVHFSCRVTQPFRQVTSMGFSSLCLEKPKPQCLFLSITYSLCRGSIFSCRATAPLSPSRQQWAFLRFVLKNLTHNVFSYQSPTRFAGVHFLLPSDPSRPGDKRLFSAFILKNRIHNVSSYQSLPRFAGSCFFLAR